MERNVDATFAALREFWRSRGIQTNPGAADGEIDAHQVRFAIRLPDDVRAYFRAVNGMSSGPESRADMDDDLIRFYPLAECRPLSVEWPEDRLPDAEAFLCFADYSIWCWGYGVRVRTPEAGEVHALYGGKSVKVADSFIDFLAAYLRRDHSVTFPR
jgi:hypothetical protein